MHFEEVFEYWEGILERAGQIDPVALVNEKLGYERPMDYAVWLLVTHLGTLENEGLRELWAKEQDLCKRAPQLSIKEIAERRISQIHIISNSYE